MSDRPINFRAPEVRALLDGRKSQTRRVLKPQPGVVGLGGAENILTCDEGYAVAGRAKPQPMPYAVGDRLWVREAWRTMGGQDAFSGAQIAAQCADAGYKRVWSPIQYRANGERANWIADPHTFGKEAGRIRHAIHMPRWASRLTLTVTDVRVERLQDISEADAVAEGIEQARSGRFYNPTMSKSAAAHLGGMFYGPRPAFEVLWNSIHGPEAWDANPWCVALTFETHRCNIDQMPGGDHE